MKNLILSLLFSFLFLVLPLFGYAVVDVRPAATPTSLEENLTAPGFSTSEMKISPKKVKRKLRLKERIISKIIQRRIKRQARKKTSEEWLESNARISLGISIVGLILALVAFGTANLGLVIFSLICGLVGLTANLFLLEQYKDLGIKHSGKGLAIAGAIIGLLVGSIWSFTLGYFFLDGFYL